MYKLIDLQGDNGFSITKKKYKTKKELLEALMDFHEHDFDGVTAKEYLKGYEGILRS